MAPMIPTMPQTCFPNVQQQQQPQQQQQQPQPQAPTSPGTAAADATKLPEVGTYIFHLFDPVPTYLKNEFINEFMNQLKSGTISYFMLLGGDANAEGESSKL